MVGGFHLRPGGRAQPPGAKSVLVRTGHGANAERELRPGQADAVVADLAEAAEWIIANER